MNITTLNSNPQYKFQTQKKMTNLSFKGVDKSLTQDVLEIKGSQTKAKVFTNNIDYQTFGQIKNICSHPVFKDLPVRIMPDTHAGKTAVVGFTAPIGAAGEVIPSLISGDIGCGMLCVNIDTNGKDIDFEQLDNIIRTYVSSSHTKEASSYSNNMKKIEKQIDNLCKKYKVSPAKAFSTFGTLGGGNHFIEIDTDSNGEKYLVIHTGSRGFGKEVFEHHQKVALEQNPYKMKDLSYLTGSEAQEYLDDMKIAVKYSELNRRTIADEILKRMDWKEKNSFESIHNYISEDNIIRKGAIHADAGKPIIIPLNMRDGAILATGQGNPDWNCSAPHGAGRQFSRAEASELITVEDFKQEMKGIYTSCISKSTVDEAPDAYKSAKEIIENISATAKIDKIIKPIFNFKDSVKAIIKSI